MDAGNKYQIIGVGELLWDLLPSGAQLGGAPGNFVYHAGALGAEAYLLSRVGADDLGRRATEHLVTLGLPVLGIEVDSQLATGTVSVSVGADGQPQFEIHENVAWDALRGDSPARSFVSSADAVCFGTLAQRREPSRSSIRAVVAAAPRGALRVLDVNLRQHYFTKPIIEDSLRQANVLKLNDTELPCLASMFELRGNERDQINELAARFQLRAVAYTRGVRGSLLWTGGRFSEHPGIPARVVDSVGAGDAFTAVMTLGLLAEWDLDRINAFANEIASYVCAHAGATPRMPAKFRVF